jgi:hypothetical protein
MWAPQLDAEGLSQGDLVEDLYFANLHPITAVSKQNHHGKPGYIEAQWKEDREGIGLLVVRARRSLGLVLSHSCDIDKGSSKSRVMVAPVVLLSRYNDEEQQKIIGQTRVALFPLVGTVRGDMVADLRLAMAFDPRLFRDGARVQSMTDSGRKMLQSRLIFLYSRLT